MAESYPGALLRWWSSRRRARSSIPTSADDCANIDLAEELGTHVVTLFGDDIAQQLAQYAGDGRRDSYRGGQRHGWPVGAFPAAREPGEPADGSSRMGPWSAFVADEGLTCAIWPAVRKPQGFPP